MIWEEIYNEFDYTDMVSRLNGETFEGKTVNGHAQNDGRYTLSNGLVYEGNFNEGAFDGHGTLLFPDGGRFVAKWKQGQLEKGAGTYYYADGCEFKVDSWKYCTDADRRFWSEIQSSIKLGDVPQFTNDKVPSALPKGCYDIGDGYYNPVDQQAYHYDGSYLRTPSEEEANWAVAKCRVGLRVGKKKPAKKKQPVPVQEVQPLESKQQEQPLLGITEQENKEAVKPQTPEEVELANALQAPEEFNALLKEEDSEPEAEAEEQTTTTETATTETTTTETVADTVADTEVATVEAAEAEVETVSESAEPVEAVPAEEASAPAPAVEPVEPAVEVKEETQVVTEDNTRPTTAEDAVSEIVADMIQEVLAAEPVKNPVLEAVKEAVQDIVDEALNAAQLEVKQEQDTVVAEEEEEEGEELTDATEEEELTDATEEEEEDETATEDATETETETETDASEVTDATDDE